MELIIVRHGRPVRIEGADGIADPELAPVGLKQAEAVADCLQALEIDLVVSSPLLRARQTAAPLLKRLSLDAQIIHFDSKKKKYMHFLNHTVPKYNIIFCAIILP